MLNSARTKPEARTACKQGYRCGEHRQPRTTTGGRAQSSSALPPLTCRRRQLCGTLQLLLLHVSRACIPFYCNHAREETSGRNLALLHQSSSRRSAIQRLHVPRWTGRHPCIDCSTRKQRATQTRRSRLAHSHTTCSQQQKPRCRSKQISGFAAALGGAAMQPLNRRLSSRCYCSRLGTACSSTVGGRMEDTQSDRLVGSRPML